MKLSEAFCQRLLYQNRLVDPNGFICNANFSFMKIRAAINVFVIPSHPICHHCAVCMWVMTPKHPIIYAALAYGHSWCREWHYFKLGWFFGHWRLSAGIIITSVWLKHRRHQGYNGWKASWLVEASEPILPASAKTDSISGDEFKRHGWPNLPALSPFHSCQCCAIKTSFNSKTKRRKNWWDDSFAPYLS